MVKEVNEFTIQSDKQFDTIIDSEEHVDEKNWLRNNSGEQVDVINDSEKLVVDENDSERDPSVATHTANRISATDTTNRISTQNIFINPAIQAVVQPNTSLVTVKVELTQESFSVCQTSLP